MHNVFWKLALKILGYISGAVLVALVAKYLAKWPDNMVAFMTVGLTTTNILFDLLKYFLSTVKESRKAR